MYARCKEATHIWLGNFRKLKSHSREECKVASEVVGGARGPIVIIVEVIQCKVD
jgi:hypothetical protein